VWTPKRVLLLAVGFTVFLSSYVVYAHFLGGIDGLPELPPEYWPAETPGPLPPPPDRGPSLAEKKLIEAFGENQQIRECPIKLEIRAKGLVLAARTFIICDDGRVKFETFFLAIFGKDKGDGRPVEINTVKSKKAYLHFDRPVGNFTEISNRKIIGGTLENDIYIVNNRRTPQQDDDISLFTDGPIEYVESLHHVWTKNVVRITDPQTKPEPMTITATGADLYLTAEDPPAKGPGAQHKNRNETVSGVERIHLRQDVDMNLWVDGNSGFMGGASKDDPAAKGEKPKAKPVAEKARASDPKGKHAAAAAKTAPPPKARVTIQTQGPFVYDVKTDHARFDFAQQPNPSPNNVVVKRLNGLEGKLEQLVCDHLELQFLRKGRAEAKAPSDDREVDLEIRSAHAWGADVTLTSDSENLNAFGNDLVYDAEAKQSVIKGEPEMVAAKDGNFIHARELRLWHDSKAAEQARAKGPGFIEMLDRASGERPLLARWKGELVYGRDGAFDLLVLTGDATFEDKVQAQQLRGDLIKVWLTPADKPTPATNETQRRRPDHLEAVGHVETTSAELCVHDTEHLLVRFHDGPPITPPAAPAPPPGQLVSRPATAPEAAPKAAVGTPPPAAKGGPAEPKAEKRPIDLSARSVESDVRRSDNKNDLEKLWCEGRVLVKQAPASPQDKGVDIRGDTLQLTRQAEGNILAVTGDLAQVQMDKLFLVGPVVNIDQVTNTAWVKGMGAMRMPSDKTLDGNKLSKPSELTIHWKKTMYFNGKFADFQGDVQAEQDTGRLLCQTLQAFFDKPISLKEGDKQGQSARVEKLVSDKNVRVEDTVRENGKLRSYKRIESRELDLDNEEGVADAPGPGIVRIIQVGNKEDFGTPKADKPKAQPPRAPAKGQADEEQLKLTRVCFNGRMRANNKTRVAVFLDDVEVVNLPSDNPDIKIDVDRLPPGAMYLRCERLDVRTRELPGGKTSQEMDAQKKVRVQAQEFWGMADRVTYDESQERLIFEGGEGGSAVLYQFKVPGGQPRVVRARKIFYFRRTNEYQLEGVQGINSN
jgi:hypothetical protein